MTEPENVKIHIFFRKLNIQKKVVTLNRKNVVFLLLKNSIFLPSNTRNEKHASSKRKDGSGENIDHLYFFPPNTEVRKTILCFV